MHTKKEAKQALKMAWHRRIDIVYYSTDDPTYGELQLRSSGAKYFYRATSEFCAADVYTAERAIRKAAIKAAIKAAVARVRFDALSDRDNGARYSIRARSILRADGALRAIEDVRDVAAEYGYSPTQRWRSLVLDLINVAGLAK